MRLESGLLYCESLSKTQKTQDDIQHFSVLHEETGKGLVRYLQESASFDEELGSMRTYFVRMRGTQECVGYFSLKAGLVSLRETQFEDKAEFDTLPGVELANFAVNAAFVRKYHVKGIGGVIFTDFILPIIREAAGLVGICLVYLFALPHAALLKNYERYGFQRLSPEAESQLHKRLKPAYDQSCIFMCQPLKLSAEIQ